jgi:hypothetical protein
LDNLTGSVHACRSLARTTLGVVSILAPALGQVFVDSAAKIPSGVPDNLSDTEQVDFGDIDSDGDLDAVFANGGDSGSQQSRVWINQGFAQGGTAGFFGDETVLRFPAVLDPSRDIELVDIDADGDLDIQLANSAQLSNRPSRWWINQGGLQGGNVGFFVDETATRWVGLNSPASSIASSLLLPGGGFVDYSSDGDFADFDNDGAPDLLHTSVGQAHNGVAPTRIFLNDGSGGFVEFNPSGFKLTSVGIANGQPGLWCEGVQQSNTTNATGAFCDVATTAIDSDVGDIDGDFDIDILGGDRQTKARVYRNRLVENGGLLGFRDATQQVLTGSLGEPFGKYEQEFGDLDNDGDLDLYGVNWASGPTFPMFRDLVATNNGGVFTFALNAPSSAADEEEADFIDYDNDGDLDVFVANFSGRDQLHRNDLAGGVVTLTNVTTSSVPNVSSISRDIEVADLDLDGDFDAMTANGSGDRRNVYYENVTGSLDVHAPRIPALEQVSNGPTGATPIAVRAHVLDNQPDYLTRFNTTTLEHRINGGAWIGSPMSHSGAQVFRGELPPNLSGSIEYRVRSIDPRGNVGVSTSRVFSPGFAAVSYCTAGTSSGGCVASLSAIGAPSVSASSGFTLSVSGAEGQRQGLVFYGVSGPLSTSFPPGGTGFLCVKLPVQRMAVSNSGGAAFQCDGALQYDWLAYVTANPGALGAPFASGVSVHAQCWLRDGGSPGGSILSQGLEFATLP